LIIEYLKPKIIELYLSLKQIIFVDSSIEKKNKRKELEKQINYLSNEIFLYSNSIKALSNLKDIENELTEALEQNLIKTKLTEFIDIIIKDQALHYSIGIYFLKILDFSQDDTSDKILKELPKNIFLLISNFKKSKNIDEIFQHFDKLSENCNYYLKNPDKKKIKQQILTKKYEISQTIEKTLNPPEILLNLM
jgi:hypothetical protein